MGGPPQWYRTEPIPIWSDFWKGFFMLWKHVLSGLPPILKFWAWDWEAVGYLTAIITLAGVIVLALVGLLTLVIP